MAPTAPLFLFGLVARMFDVVFVSLNADKGGAQEWTLWEHQKHDKD